LEVAKIQLNFKPNDWWSSQLDGGITIQSSRSHAATRQIGNLTVTHWDNVQVHGTQDWTIQHFLNHMEEKIGLNVNMITQNSKMIFIKALPTHVNKKKKL
jgi:hypothetical protein